MKILAADDSPTMLEILATTLREGGHDVVQADNGAEALKRLDHSVQLIISDLNMVQMSGFEFLQNVREDPGHCGTPFVFLTTENDTGLKRAARSAGATAWMVKPFNPSLLLQLVDRLTP